MPGLEVMTVTQFDQLKQQVKTIYALVQFQKASRLAIRALWLGIAGILASWAANAILGWLPSPPTWFLIGLGFASVPLGGALMALLPVIAEQEPPRTWIWSIDQRFRLKEQLSTAWEVVHSKQGGPIERLLAQEMLAVLPRAKDRLLEGGWYNKIDLVASALMSMMACLFLASLLFFAPTIPPVTTAPTPGIPQTAPQPPDIQESPPTMPQPDHADGQNNAPENGEQGGNNANQNGAERGSTPGNQPDSADPKAVADALQQLGEQLSQQAGTYDLGQALENLDMNGAADALDHLKEQVDELSPESQENLSQALEDAAQALSQTDAESLSENMGEAANSLQDSNGSAKEDLGQVANDLRQLDGAMQAQRGENDQNANGGGTGEGQSSSSAGQAEPLDRLSNEGGQMELPLDNPDQSGLLSPGQPDTPAEGTASGTLDATRQQGSQPNQSPLLPNSFLWKWRDVVKEYFQR